MSTSLTPGANTSLPDASALTVELTAANAHADLIALLLDEDGRADGDDGVVLFSHPVSAGGAVSLDVANDVVSLNMRSLPARVQRVLVVAQADGTPDVSACQSLTATVSADGAPVASAAFADLPRFPVLQLVELYRRNGAWKVRSRGDGYADGLAKLLTVHGVSVEDDAQSATPAAPPASPSPASGGVSFQKVTGKVDLRKGDRPVIMEKTASISATVSWPSATDYDVYALVLTADGEQVDVATFGAKGVDPLMSYKGVRHTGDVLGSSDGDTATETIEIRLTPDILAVIPVAYSAQSNGTGSFQRYQVSLAIDNKAGTEVNIAAANANADDNIYTCVPGMIRNSPDGVIVEPLELYSKRNSENRPRVRLKDGEVTVEMDAGPKNDYK